MVVGVIEERLAAIFRRVFHRDLISEREMDEKNLQLADATADMELNEDTEKVKTVVSKLHDKQQTFR